MFLKTMYIFWIIINIPIFIQGLTEKCIDGNICPSSKPFCTPVGCTFQCPENSFSNGTKCVQNCGSQFVFNHTCIEVCPDQFRYVEEEIALLNDFAIVRHCRHECPTNKFVYNGTCVHSCPENANFVEDGECTSSCSSQKTVYRSISKNGITVGKECLKNCYESPLHPFQEGVECVPKCGNNYFVSNRACVLKCPIDSSLVFNLSLCVKIHMFNINWPEQNYCTQTCPQNMYLSNSTCVDTCPTDALYTLNKECLKTCPDSYRYECTKMYEHCYNDSSPKCFYISCCNECPDGMKVDIKNSVCVTDCPQDMKAYDKKCVSDCLDGSFFNSPGSSQCTRTCENFILGDTCVDDCPNYVFNRTCVDICPFGYNMTNGTLCVADCPPPSCSPVKGQNCSNHCFFEPYSKMWVNSCPENMPYIFNNVTLTVCVAHCPNGYIIDGFKCILVHECERAVLSKGQCLDSCPVGYLIFDVSQADKYSSEDESDDPCVPESNVYAFVAMFGFYLLFYGIFLLFYFCSGCFCMNRYNRTNKQVSIVIM
ncbi:proprotein convertase subtilisin/kexin type 5-like [Mercenaria mercenaria]|uniref:proprotein convertase subtilisin/kexin type 5-like n=1 Tax=Mercenaria mercenaria TaxID=6596 RepID=UPI00234F5C86|nr:proprotein convertase subtilisin/kexin type 5-like [Mercenaria mercenaria]